MRINYSQQLMLKTSIGLLFISLLILILEKKIPIPPITATHYKLETNALFQKKVIPNRLPLFIQFLHQQGIPIQNEFELLLLLSNPNARQQITRQLSIDANLLLLHAELADLKQIGMTEIDAQILHFSQRNYQNPFTNYTINLKILAKAEPEKMLEDIGGWAAGNNNPLVKNYHLSLEKIEKWKTQSKKRNWSFLDEVPI